jgi:hypothetical protein
LRQPVGAGGTNREHIEKALAIPLLSVAQRTKFEAQLAGPDRPEDLEYLRGWAHRIHGRSGVTMSGFAPATFDTVLKWARLAGIDDLSLDEAEIVLGLDAILCIPAPDAAPKTPT